VTTALLNVVVVLCRSTLMNVGLRQLGRAQCEYCRNKRYRESSNLGLGFIGSPVQICIRADNGNSNSKPNPNRQRQWVQVSSGVGRNNITPSSLVKYRTEHGKYPLGVIGGRGSGIGGYLGVLLTVTEVSNARALRIYLAAAETNKTRFACKCSCFNFPRNRPVASAEVDSTVVWIVGLVHPRERLREVSFALDRAEDQDLTNQDVSNS